MRRVQEGDIAGYAQTQTARFDAYREVRGAARHYHSSKTSVLSASK